MNAYWPQLRLNYSQNTTTNDTSPKTSDQQSYIFDSSFKYKWRFPVIFSTSFSNSIDTNKIEDTENENTNHSTRIQWQDTYWNNRLSVIASHKYSHDKNHHYSHIKQQSDQPPASAQCRDRQPR